MLQMQVPHGPRPYRRDVPITPLPPQSNFPAAPGDPSNDPMIPLPPIVGNPEQPPAAPGPSYPVFPVYPVYPGMASVRFLNAAYGYERIRIMVSNRSVPDLPFGGLSAYYRIPDGFQNVTVTTTDYPRVLLYQGSVPFRSGEISTMAFIKTNFGFDLLPVSDRPCTNRPSNRACIRTVNLVYNSPPLDVILTDGRIVFSDVRYKEITPFKQARSKEYAFYIAQTPYTLASALDIETFDQLPVVLANYFLPGYGDVNPLVSFYVDAKPGSINTIYLLGSWENSAILRVKVVQDF